MNRHADWRLPPGVSPAVWQYAHDESTAANYDADLAETPLLNADLEFVRRHLRAPCRVIDLGCGTGRIAIPLARDGYRVVGVDLAQPMLRAAGRKPDGGSVAWACDNVVNLAAWRDGSFDAAICMFSTLGMIAGHEARRQALGEMHRVLRPGGLLLLHVHHLHHLLTTSAGRKSWLRDRFGRRKGDFTMPAANGLPGWTMHLFTRREIQSLLAETGFTDTKITAVGIDGIVRRGLRARTAYGFLIAAHKSAM